MRKAVTGGVAAATPTTLATLLAEFMKQHAEEKHCRLPPSEGYDRISDTLRPELLAMNMKEITSLHLSREVGAVGKVRWALAQDEGTTR